MSFDAMLTASFSVIKVSRAAGRENWTRTEDYRQNGSGPSAKIGWISRVSFGFSDEIGI
jgi:hypothetical protein